MQVRENYDQIVQRDAQVLVVTFAAPAALRGFEDELALPFPLAADPQRQAYRAYRLRSATRWQLWHPRVIARYLALIRRGMRPRPAERGQDVSQLGGDFVIDARGIIVLARPSQRPDDRPPLPELLAALDAAAERSQSS